MPLRRLPRFSEYHYLPEYGIDNITTANARIDKAEIHFNGLNIQATTPAAFQEYFDDCSIESTLFTRVRGSNKLKTRAGWLLIIPPALIRIESHNPVYAPFTLKFVLNYSRFYQSNRPQIRPDSDCDKVFMRNETNLDYAKEYSIEKKKADNILIRSAWRDTADVPELFCLMVTKARQLVEMFMPVPEPDSHYDILHHLSLNGIVHSNIVENKGVVPYFDWSQHYFKELEVYWDFQHENAIGFVDSQRTALKTAAASVFEVTFSP